MSVEEPITYKAPFTKGEIAILRSYLFKNIASTKNIFLKTVRGQVIRSIPGAVLASPTKPGPNFNQDYRFDWVRDAAITMDYVTGLYERAANENEKAFLREYLVNYISWVQNAQKQPPLNQIDILGEPKFNIDGSIWVGQWSRPQNDGPALRAITLIHIANLFLDEVEKGATDNEALINTLYNQTESLIKTDLEYIAKHWHENTVGPWEETNGIHFFSSSVQRKALFEGAMLADRLEDTEAAAFYREQVARLERVMPNHWQESLGYYNETVGQIDTKEGGLTTSVIMALVYGKIDSPGDRFSIIHVKSLSSAYYIRYCFEGLYQINLKDRIAGTGGPMLGRYENDIYDGYQANYGNPWFLTTHLFAEFYYTVARELFKKREIEITFLTRQFYKQVYPQIEQHPDQIITLQKDPELFLAIITSLILAADEMLRCVKQHTETYDDGSTLHISEQLDRCHGFQVSAQDLTWSYCSLLTALRSREKTLLLLNDKRFEI